MDVKLVNPFIDSFQAVMPQLGFSNIELGRLTSKTKEVTGNGLIVVLGLVGDFRGNVVYMLQIEAAKKIASTMMMGTPVEVFDDLAGSALAEMTNMLTANAATCFSNIGVKIDISTPTMLSGENMSVKMSSEQILCVELLADNIPIEVNISFEN